MQIDHILLNGNIHTMNPEKHRATALAIWREHIVAVGDDDEIADLASRYTRITNLEGLNIFPGLIDAHIHWEGYARSLQAVDLWEVPTKAEALRRVAAKVNQTPPGEWIYGRGWFQDIWDGKAFPTAADLDSVAPRNPVYLTAKSGHAAWVNSLALKQANITVNTPNPSGGGIHHLADGSPSGILLEDPAMDLVYNQIPKPTRAQLVEWMADAQAKALQMGLVGFHDFDDPSCMDALQVLREHGDLQMRVVKQINKDWLESAIALGIRSGFGDDWIRFGGLKLFADGALGPRTALMIQPYENEPDNTGIAVVEKEEMMALIRKASANGLLSTVHAIGDRAVHDVLDIFDFVRQEESERGVDRDLLRHRIEHVQIIHPMDVGRLAELDVIASMQPIHMAGDYQMAEAVWGERAEYSYAWRKQLAAGAVLAFGSDAPIEPVDPLKGIHTALTRRKADGSPGPAGWYPQERLNMREALRAYTHAPAYAAGMEHYSGMLAPGYLADLIALDHDLFTVPPMDILEIQVKGTMVGGQWRYQSF